MSLIVNFFGGPCCGKSTLAAGLFYELKLNGYNVELVREFAKDLVYEDEKEIIKNQPYVTGTQFHRQMQPFGKADIVVTDSPILLGMFFNVMPIKTWGEFIFELFNSFDNFNILLERTDEIKFDSNSRVHDIEQSRIKDQQILDFLVQNNLEFHKVPVAHRKTLEIIYPLVEWELAVRGIKPL